MTSGFLALMDLTTILLLLWNFLFLYGKFQDQIVPIAAPHCDKACEVLGKYWSMIPRYKKEEEKKDN
jgi:hypothetical protein